jgi:phosphoserine phosphatase RsbU/P
VSEVKLEVRRKDGKTLPMILNIVERPWNGSSLWHVAAFIAEDRHKYERELVLQRKRAEDLAEQHARDQQEIAAARAQAEDRALFAEQLVGVVSHDIRNPLSVIHMSTVLLERGVTAEQQQSVIARVARAVTRVQHLIADLLDFTQARLGRGLSARPATVDLHQAVADAVSELGVAFPGIEIRHVQAGTDLCLADADRITQAVGNLVANAVNHGATGQPVTVRTESGDAGFRIAVHNQGRPIPPGLVPTLFEPMVRGESGSASKGVGLGLYIVREIARSHGGSVQVHSSEAEGTTFTIELPAAAG